MAIRTDCDRRAKPSGEARLAGRPGYHGREEHGDREPAAGKEEHDIQ
jgi:hypothetical protein